MQFQKKFLKHQVKVWEDFYFNYDLLIELLKPFRDLHKEKIKAMYKKQQQLTSTSDPELNQPLTTQINENPKFNIEQTQQKINEQIILECKKVDHFYSSNFNGRLKPRLKTVKDQIDHAKALSEFGIYQDSFEMALKELYKEVHMIKTFAEENIYAKDKIILKFNKYTQFIDKEILLNIDETIGEFYSKLDLSTAKKDTDSILDELTMMFNVYFVNKYKGKTSKVLKSYNEANKFTQTQSFYLGFFIGLLIFQFILIVFIAYNYNIDMDNDVDFKSVFPMFRTFFVLCLYWWMLGFNVWVWNKASISYRVIFQFDNHYSDVISIYKRAAIFTFILLGCVLLYMFDRIGLENKLGITLIPMHMLPLVCWGSLLIYMFCPIKSIFNYEGRTYMFKLIAESLGSFFMKPDFKHTWTIGQLTSLVGPMRDMEYTLCYYAYYEAPLNEKKIHCSNTRGVFLFLAFFPTTIRILQTLKVMSDTGKRYPHILNITKFTISLFVSLFSFLKPSFPVFYPVWFATSLVSTCFGVYWDLYMDYGFFVKGNKNFPLRDKLLYKSKVYYYMAIVVTVFLKFFWLLTISPEIVEGWFRPETLSIISFSLTILGRCMWNCFKLEMKHLDISKEFRVGTDVELPYIRQNGKYVVNESNLLEIMGMSREEKIKVEMDKILEEKKKKKVRYESRFIHEFEPQKKVKINDELNEYLQAYKMNTEQNLNQEDNAYFGREFSRKI